MAAPVRLVAFDVDGTLLRGATVCELLAEPLGFAERMRELERNLSREEDVRAASEEMAGWYAGRRYEELCQPLRDVELAPGAVNGVRLLRERGISVALVSVTWSFAIGVLARRLGVDDCVGTDLLGDGTIRYFRPPHKADWLAERASSLGVALDEVAAVGDSRGDWHMLRCAGRAYYVGPEVPPPELGALHRPAADIGHLVAEMLA